MQVVHVTLDAHRKENPAKILSREDLERPGGVLTGSELLAEFTLVERDQHAGQWDVGVWSRDEYQRVLHIQVEAAEFISAAMLIMAAMQDRGVSMSDTSRMWSAACALAREHRHRMESLPDAGAAQPLTPLPDAGRIQAAPGMCGATYHDGYAQWICQRDAGHPGAHREGTVEWGGEDIERPAVPAEDAMCPTCGHARRYHAIDGTGCNVVDCQCARRREDF